MAKDRFPTLKKFIKTALIFVDNLQKVLIINEKPGNNLISKMFAGIAFFNFLKVKMLRLYP